MVPAALKQILMLALCLSIGLGFECCHCPTGKHAHSGTSTINAQNGLTIKAVGGGHDCHCRQIVARTCSLRKLEIQAPAVHGCPAMAAINAMCAALPPKAFYPDPGPGPSACRPPQSLLRLHCALII